METSSFLANHEMIGASVLLVVDPEAGVSAKLIDLAKTSRVPRGMEIDHYTAWTPGNHEDGVLFGLGEMLRCWGAVVRELGRRPEIQEGNNKPSTKSRAL